MDEGLADRSAEVAEKNEQGDRPRWVCLGDERWLDGWITGGWLDDWAGGRSGCCFSGRKHDWVKGD